MMARKVLPTPPEPVVQWELNDLRPMRIPKAADVMRSDVIPNFFVVVTEYLDGFLVLVLFDAGKYREEAVAELLDDWLDVLERTVELG